MMTLCITKMTEKRFLFFLQSLDRQGDLKSLSLGEINHGFSWEQVKLPCHNSLKLKCSVAYITYRGSQAIKYCGPDLKKSIERKRPFWWLF